MISSVTGRVAGRDGDGVVVEVGGVGLEVLATRAAAQLAEPGAIVTLATHLYVREDALTLFGFASPDERALFRLLMSVTGIGPRLALAIVSAYPPAQLVRAIADADVALLATVSGVGRKTAQRICVDLRDRVGLPAASGVGAVAVAARPGLAMPDGADLDEPAYAAREALLALGYALGDAEAALGGVDGTVEARVRVALGRLRNAP